MLKYMFIATICVTAISCNNETSTVDKVTSDSTASAQQETVSNLDSLPAPYQTKSVTKRAKVIEWDAGKKPVVPEGFSVNIWIDKLESPRWMYVADNGDVFVAQADREGKKGNNVLLFRDKDNDGTFETKTVYIKNLNQPFGMEIVNDKFYVANNDAVLEFPYDPASTTQSSAGKKIASLPGKPGHWTRNLLASPDKSKMYIAVGSGSNVAENGFDKEVKRANILQINLDGTQEKIYASGLRNPVGMAWAPGTNTLWTAVNERDELGDDVPPDYLTSVQEGGFYGWPYSYFGQNVDPQVKKEDQRPDLVAKAIVPEVALGSHTASLGLVFYEATAFPSTYKNGAFVAQHGSWNRSHFSGYKVVFVPFSNGKPSGKPQDFMTGFIANEDEVYGRPVGLAILKDGSLLVTDDGGGRIWKISYAK
jgi:glucose/arabinose dehydrogenase